MNLQRNAAIAVPAGEPAQPAELIELPRPSYHANLITVRTVYTGICATDVPYLLGKADPRTPESRLSPTVAFHEVVGEVIHSGREALAIPEGTMVVPLVRRCQERMPGGLFTPCCFMGSCPQAGRPDGCPRKSKYLSRGTGKNSGFGSDYWTDEGTVERASVQTGGGKIQYYALRCKPDLFSSPIFPRIPDSADASSADKKAAHKSAIKFAVFSHAVVKLLISPEGQQLLGDWFPHVIHCHDWPTGLIPAYLARLYDEPKYWEPHRKPRTLFTYHSCPPGDGAQGVFTHDNSKWVADGLLRACGWGQGANEPVYAGDPNLHHECDSTVWRSHDPDWSKLNCAVSFLKAGLAFSDEANTVSPGCALEMQDPPHSLGNEALIGARSSRNEWQGIRNGIDWEIYDAERDGYIIAPYTVKNWKNVKKRNKVELLNHPHFGLDCRLQQLAMERQGRTVPLQITAYQLSLPDFNLNQDFILNFHSFHLDEDAFLAVLPARLEWQKGVDIVLAGMYQLFEELDRLHFILMGRGSETRNCASTIQRLASDFPDRFMFINWFDPEESPIWERLLIAAADAFIMPSRTEPCGIAQQRALHYGTVVIGSEVGGLRMVAGESEDAPENTVIKLDVINGENPSPENANTILFPLQYPANPNTPRFTEAVEAFKEAMKQAYDIWQNNPPTWEKLVENAMTYQNSWDYPIEKYREKYMRLAK